MGYRKPNRKGRSKGDARHVRLYHWMLKSEAWRSLDCKARCALVELYGLYNGRNNGDLFLSVRELAARLRCGKATASKAFRALEERGFIRAKERGAFNVKHRHATTWILTEFEYAGKIPSKEFMRWRPTEN